MDGDRPCGIQRSFLPHAAIDLIGGEDRACVLHEKSQDIVLLRREIHFLSVHAYGLGAVIQFDAADAELGGLHAAAAKLQVAPELRANPRLHLQGVEGLCDVVIRADVEPQHLVAVFALSGQENDGDVGELANLRHGSETVHLGHHDIEENEVDILFGCDGKGFPPGLCFENAVSLRSQINFQRRENVFLVVADQNVVHSFASLLFTSQFYKRCP